MHIFKNKIILIISVIFIPIVLLNIYSYINEKITENREIDFLIKKIESGSTNERVATISKIKKVKNIRLVKSLIMALKDIDNNVRDEAARALGNTGDISVFEPILYALKNDMIDINVASETLGKLGKPAIELLILSLKDVNTKKDAAEVLGHIGGNTAVNPLLNSLKDCSISKTAAMSLGIIGDKISIPLLISTLKEGNDCQRSASAIALGYIKDTRAIEPLISALNDRPIASHVMEALEIMEDKSVVPLLITVLQTGEHNESINAARALGRLADNRAVEPLIAVLKSGDDTLSESALSSLVKLGDKSAVPLLISIIKGTNPTGSYKEVKSCKYAAKALGLLKDTRANESLFAILMKNLCGHMDKNCDVDKDYSTKYYEWSRVKEEAAIALGEIGDKSAANFLFQALKNVQCHGEAIRGLCKINKSYNTEYLIRVLDIYDNSYSIAKAAETLGEIGDQKAIPHLTRVLNNWDAKEVVAQSLLKLSWTPQCDSEKIHLYLAKKEIDFLIQNWNMVKKVLFEDFKTTKYSTIEYVIYSFIYIGEAEIIPFLVDALDKHGFQHIPEAYLNSGNEELELAAKEWAERRGHSIYRFGNNSPKVTWGNK